MLGAPQEQPGVFAVYLLVMLQGHDHVFLSAALLSRKGMNMGTYTCDTQLYANLSLSSNEKVVLCSNPVLAGKMEASITVSKITI